MASTCTIEPTFSDVPMRRGSNRQVLGVVLLIGIDLPMADKLSLETLESWLWESANILRGSIDSSDFKNYIFGLLFLKRYNDVFDERVTKLMKDESLSYSDAQEEIEDKSVNR